MRKKGLSLLEILISTLILALLMLGLGNIFVAGKRLILHSRSRMTGGELGKYFLDDFQMLVRQDTWSTNCLGLGNCPPEQKGTADGLDRDYTANYTINNGQPITNVNRVKVDIIWNEPPP